MNYFYYVLLLNYGIFDMSLGSYSHLTLWTWNYHCLSRIYIHFTKKKYIVNNLYLTSFVGSYCILNSYLFVLYLNPNLEHDINFNKSKSYIWLRSLVLHLTPCILSTYDMYNNCIYLPIKSYYSYLIIPSIHLLTGILYKSITGKNNFNSYHIYVNYNNKKSNIRNINQLSFITFNLGIMLSTIHICKKLSDKLIQC